LALPSWFLVTLTASAIVAGGGVATAVILTSGPFADSDEQVAPATPAPSETASPSAAASPSPTAVSPTATPAADDRLDVDERFDPALLPAVDTSDWVAYAGEQGAVRVRAPRDFTVWPSTATDYTGTEVLGDAFKIRRIAAPLDGKEFNPEPGDVWIDMTMARKPIGYETDEPYLQQLRYPILIQGVHGEVVATQFEQPANFLPGVGALTLHATIPGPAGRFMIAGAQIALPADLATIAIAQEILKGMEWE
jgi:hypothetical protein